MMLLGGTDAKQPEYDFVVAADGSGDFLTVQEAVEAATEGDGLILIKPGEYKEQVELEE